MKLRNKTRSLSITYEKRDDTFIWTVLCGGSSASNPLSLARNHQGKCLVATEALANQAAIFVKHATESWADKAITLFGKAIRATCISQFVPVYGLLSFGDISRI